MPTVVVPEGAGGIRAPGHRSAQSAAALVLAAAGLLLTACGSLPPPSPSPPPPPQAPAPATPADRRASLPSALSVERQWLQSWFAGTPVSIVQRGFGVLAIEVPREFCFEPGQRRAKPALAAVLDKVAQSMRRMPEARLSLIAAPADTRAGRALAVQRADEVRRQLRSRGVAAARLAPSAVSDIAAVQLQLDIDD